MVTVGNTTELVGMAEIARELGVPRTTASMWHVRRAKSGFPAPIKDLDMGPVFDMAAVRHWYETSDYPTRKEVS
jgi:hypothetical protein